MKKISLILLSILFAFNVNAQNKKIEKKDTTAYVFTVEKQLPATSVKSQYASGTCWCFATLSFLESELIRMGKGEYDLSEMFVVRNNYHDRAIDYVRYHGKKSFSAGAEAWDVFNAIDKYGIVPENVYSGLNYGTKKHIHGEMDAVLKACVDAVIKNKNHKLTPVWIKAFDGILDTYLGKVPETFTYKDKEYTPKSFAKHLGLNLDDYITVTSFEHHPYYSKFIFEGPDNWSLGSVYNVPLDEMIKILDNSINEGYTVAWGSDVSEKGFAFRKGLAVVPEADIKNMTDTERAKWEKLTEKEKKALLYKFDKPGKEKKITPDMRQQDFDNYSTTEDHLMHITGIAKDQNGTKYYIVKNSWGEDNKYKGYFYASEAFIRFKTVSILINKNVVPKKIARKLDL